MLRNQKAQAILELAILGSLIIWVFSIAISLSEKNNREQSYMHQTFRTALRLAKEANNAASLSTIDFRRMPNAYSPMELGEFQKFENDSEVLWTDGRGFTAANVPAEPKSWFQFNREAPIDVSDAGQVNSNTTSYTTNAMSTTTLQKNAARGGAINSSKQLIATDIVIGRTNIGSMNISLDSHLVEGGKYTANTMAGAYDRTTDMQ